jgi:hypothetical protein
MDLRGDSHHLIHYDIFTSHLCNHETVALRFNLASSDEDHKVNRSIFGDDLGLGRVNRRFESCNNLFGSVCTEDSCAGYDDIAS